MNTASGKNVHCLVHPGFDAGEHPEFEANILAYINYIAFRTNDILLIVTDGESFDSEQLQQFALLDIIEAICIYLCLHDGGLGDLIPVYDDKGNFNQVIVNSGLTEMFYKWCDENIDMSELKSIAQEWRVLKDEYLAGKYKGDEQSHSDKAALLNAREASAKMNLDIDTIAKKALNEFGPVVKRSPTYRNIKNRGRFFRIFQHAMTVLGKERFREVFIADGEKADTLPIIPVSHFQVFQGDMIPTPFATNNGDTQGQVFNASESSTYGNAAELRDQVTYELSLTRNEKLKQNQVQEVLSDMGLDITSDTKFVFFGEYRDRCVNNVAHVLYHRTKPKSGDSFYIGDDRLTLERPANYQGSDWGI